MIQQEHQNSILVYGIEKMGFEKPSQEISNHNFKLFFEPFTTKKRFNDFDGVILFQGIFETYKYERNVHSEIYINHSYDRNELDKRKKELNLLIDKGGFACFILHKHFKDYYNNPDFTQEEFRDTDLCKHALIIPSFNRHDIPRETRVKSLRVNLQDFLIYMVQLVLFLEIIIKNSIGEYLRRPMILLSV